MILDIAYTQHQGRDWRYPVQQDTLWSGVEVFQARNLRPACHQTAADVVTLAVADGLGGSPLAACQPHGAGGVGHGHTRRRNV